MSRTKTTKIVRAMFNNRLLKYFRLRLITRSAQTTLSSFSRIFFANIHSWMLLVVDSRFHSHTDMMCRWRAWIPRYQVSVGLCRFLWATKFVFSQKLIVSFISFISVKIFFLIRYFFVVFHSVDDTMKLNVNKELLPIKAHYFFFMACE